MRMSASFRPRWWVVLLAAGLVVVTTGSRASSVEEIVDRWVERVRTADERRAAENFRYRRLTTIEELNGRGEVVERKTKEHWVVQNRTGSRETLVREDGRSLASSEAREEERRETARRRQYAERNSSRRRGMEQVDEALIRRFQYSLEGTDTVDGRPVHVLRFRPDPAAPGGDSVADRALGRLAGRLWIDAQESEVVRIECALVSPLGVLGGVVGSLERMDLALWRHRLPGGTWVNRSLKSSLEGRKMFSRFRARLRVEQEDFSEVPPVTPSASP